MQVQADQRKTTIDATNEYTMSILAQLLLKNNAKGESLLEIEYREKEDLKAHIEATRKKLEAVEWKLKRERLEHHITQNIQYRRYLWGYKLGWKYRDW